MSPTAETRQEVASGLYVAHPQSDRSFPEWYHRQPAIRFETGGREIAVVTLTGYKVGAERSPGEWATLFAAAPELLAALQHLLTTMSVTDEEGLLEFAEPVAAARAAIAKAVL